MVRPLAFFDDDGNGNLRIYFLVAGVRTYFDALEQLIMIKVR